MERTNVKTITLTDEERESVEAEAARQDRPVSSYFRWLHARWIKERDYKEVVRTG
jgi:hypothetical protein